MGYNWVTHLVWGKNTCPDLVVLLPDRKGCTAWGTALLLFVGKGETRTPTSICYYVEFTPFDSLMIKISDTEADIIKTLLSI
jgi:hypothetical protein